MKCVEIALRCVEKDRNRRPSIKDIVQELEELEADIKKMSLHSENSEDLIGQTSSACSTILSFDPSQELRFLFEPRMNASTCLQLTNMTEGFIAFSVKVNKRKYCAQPNIGVMQPCSKRYISVTLEAQEEAPPNMQCHDMFIVQSARVSEDLTSGEITNDLLGKGKVDMMELPIVYVAKDEFPSFNT
ncbi:hypothetical protein VPH35_107500 [Triticum aestivum]